MSIPIIIALVGMDTDTIPTIRPIIGGPLFAFSLYLVEMCCLDGVGVLSFFIRIATIMGYGMLIAVDPPSLDDRVRLDLFCAALFALRWFLIVHPRRAGSFQCAHACGRTRW